MVAVELRDKMVRPWRLITGDEWDKASAVDRRGGVQSCEIKDCRGVVHEADQFGAHLTLRHAGHPDDRRDVIDIFVHGRPLVVEPVSSGELAVVGAEEYRGIVR